MEFQKLTIHNIASIEDAIIDFEAQPLADCEVFLITGKTGAGKSTILDAICLALYANTPRFYSTKMQGATMDADKEVKIDDPRQLLRRNTVEAYVSLTFVGSNGVNYEATWAVTRAYKKVSGSIKTKTWELKNLDTDVTLTKDTEIKNEIRAAVGLDFNQFCRTTMLAQGEFTRFLNSKDDEKAQILEKITGVDVYSKIGAKVYELTDQKKKDWEDAKRIVEGTRTLSEEEIAERLEKLSILDNQFKEIKTGSDKDLAKRDWLNKDQELTKGMNDAADALRTANEVVDGEAFKQKEQTVNNWNATIDARLWLTETKKASDTQTEQKNILDGLAMTYSNLLGGQKYAETKIEKLEAEINEIETYISGEIDKTSVYENAQIIVGLLNSIDEGRKAIKKSQAATESENKKLTEELTPAYEKAKDEAQKAKDDFKKEESDVMVKEEAVANLNLSELREKRDITKDLLGKIATAKERIEILASVKSEYEKSRKNLAERKASLDKKIEASAAMDAPIHDAKIKMDVRKEDLDKQSDTVHKFASTLRLKLQVGDICPVCRQEIKSVLPYEEDLAALVASLKKAFDESEKEHKALVDAKLKLDAEIKTESKAYEQDAKAFDEDKSVANAEQKALDVYKVCGIEKLDDNTLSTLNTLEESTTKTFKELDVQIKDGEKKESEVKALRKTLETNRKDVDTLAAKVSEAEKAVNECRSRISIAETLVKTKAGEVKSAENTVASLVVGRWQLDWMELPKEFASILTSSAKKYNEKVQDKQMLSNKLGTAKSNVKIVQDVLNTILLAIPSWKDFEPTAIAKVENLLTEANTLNTSVATALSKLKTAEEDLNTNQTKLNTFLTEHTNLSKDSLKTLNAYTSSDITRENESLKAAREAVVAKNTLFHNAEKLIAEHQTKKPEFAENDTLDALNERIENIEKQLTEIGEKKGAINQELKTDKESRERLGTLIKEADDKKVVYQKWARLNQLIGNSTGSTFRKIAQSYVLTSLIHSANSYMKTLTDRYTLKVTPGTFVISLEDAYQGFVSRAASTISGGESFLVSLSLALALSDIGQQWQVDTLFIDEGFGTLSGEPLQKAVETLRSLHSKAGRHVGIISHVEELQERIPVQIQVNQEGNNSSSKIKIIPENNHFS
ncbi:AAA family ATPase [Prevotella sp. HUN102]|uniref:AAA family ATPase n=1 Tax=Prevotella sp. HUN102 TaxID=1392486 RepID=UPI00048EDB6C|nr:AAA family ATPase [Prevotella sp. HUN102]